jgi:lipopolysaccharide export system permease protein
MFSLSIYSKDIFLTAARYFLFSFAVLLIISIIIQLGVFLSFGIKSIELYFDILMLCIYSIPYLIFIITPFAFLISMLFLLHRYRVEGHIISLGSFGLDLKAIHRVFFCIGIFVVIFHYLVSTMVVPTAYKSFRTMQLSLKQKHLTDFVETGTIRTEIPGVAIYVNGKQGSDLFKGIFISDTRDKRVTRIFSAKEGRINSNGSELALSLRDGSYNQIEDGKNTFIKFKSYNLSVALNADIKIDRIKDVNEMSLIEMYEFKGDSSDNNFKKIKIALHQRVIWPLYTLLFILICLRLDWYFYYMEYARGKTSKGIPMIVCTCLCFATVNFIIRNISMRFFEVGIWMNYLIPTLLLQMMLWMIKSGKTKKIKKWPMV